MIKYKLTAQDMTTYTKSCKWKIGKEKTKLNQKTQFRLCSSDVFHFYDNPELAVLLNSIHANIQKPKLFKVSCNEVIHDGLKGGATNMTLLKELPLPVFTLNQKVYFGILCAREVCKSKKWLLWADNWIKNIDRSSAATYAANAAANVAATAAAYTAADAADAVANDVAADAVANAVANAAAYAAAAYTAAAYPAANVDVINKFRHQLKTIIKKVKAFKG
mgnify:FL=1